MKVVDEALNKIHQVVLSGQFQQVETDKLELKDLSNGEDWAELARELEPVENARAEDLDIDKLNEFIQRINRDVKVETLKSDLAQARAFLLRKKFLNEENKPTLLGMLICGNNLFDYVQGRCELDGYVASTTLIVQDKQVLKDNIVQLMERAINFVFKNIQVGISVEAGGTPIPEYPERLIRETVNNALAHRDYGSSKFSTITIKPGKQIEIQNPGKFLAEQQIKMPGSEIPVFRIIPNPKARNPRLADILKSFDRWEGRGLGMAALTNAALNNEIDVPYFFLQHNEDIRLIIQKGKVLDDEMEQWLESFDGFIKKITNGKNLNHDQKTTLSYIFKSEKLNRLNRFTILLTPDNNHYQALAALKAWKLIELHPESPQDYEIFVVNRTLALSDFSSQLKNLFGNSFDLLSEDYARVLAAIFQHNEFGTTAGVSARMIARYLHTQQPYANSTFEQFYRKIKNMFNKLSDNAMIVPVENAKQRSFILNKNYPTRPDLLG